mgnify:FL=1
MKKIICLFTAIIIIMCLAACGNDDIESGSEGQEISKTEISRQDEQSFEDESSFAEVSEPVSEEISEPVSEEVSRKDPEQHIDPEDFPYRRFSAHSAAELVAKLKDIHTGLNDGSAFEGNVKEADYYAPIGGILAKGFIFNPSVDGIYAENNPNSLYGKIEMIFDSDGMVTVIYYCRNDNDVWARVQINYPEEKAGQLIAKYGADGFRMYCSGSEKPLSSLTTQEIAAMEHDSVSIQNILFEGKTFEALKYVNESRGHTNTVTFLYEDVIVTINYKYRDSERDIDDILDTIKLEKLYFDGSSEDVSRDEPPTTPDCTYGQAEEYPIFGAYDASGLVDKLIEINEQLKNGTAPLYNPSYYVCMEQILSDGYVFNPTLNGEYAKNAFDYPPVEVDFIPILTTISYDFSTKECMFRINAMYPEGKNATNISKYGIEGFAMSRFGCPDTPLDKMPEDKINYVCASAEIKTINVGGSEYTALICTNMWGIGRDTVAFLYEGKIIEIEFEPRNGCRETFESLLGKVGLEKYGFASDR